MLPLSGVGLPVCKGRSCRWGSCRSSCRSQQEQWRPVGAPGWTAPPRWTTGSDPGRSQRKTRRGTRPTCRRSSSRSSTSEYKDEMNTQREKSSLLLFNLIVYQMLAFNHSNSVHFYTHLQWEGRNEVSGLGHKCIDSGRWGWNLQMYCSCIQLNAYT